MYCFMDLQIQIAVVLSGHYLPFSDAFWIILLSNLSVSLPVFHKLKKVLLR